MLAIPGASRTVIEASVPYHEAALAAYIGGKPDQACSGKTARSLAMAALQRARRFEPAHSALFGIGCTAALTTDRDRRGADRCYVAVQSLDETVEYELTLSRQARDRASQEDACSALVLFSIATALDLDADRPALFRDESVSCRIAKAEPQWRQLFSGVVSSTGDDSRKPALVFPGAFNPLHDGHRKMAREASRITGQPVLLEISAFNVDKPPLDYMEMQARQAGLEGEFDFTFSNAPTFVDKSRLFPDATYIVGADTLERIGAPRYYHDSQDLRDQAIGKIAGRGVRFLVFGRLSDGRFKGLADLDIPESLREISIGVSESAFREDISSTHIRTKP